MMQILLPPPPLPHPLLLRPGLPPVMIVRVVRHRNIDDTDATRPSADPGLSGSAWCSVYDVVSFHNERVRLVDLYLTQ
jgi:hypothetical protein